MNLNLISWNISEIDNPKEFILAIDYWFWIQNRFWAINEWSNLADNNKCNFGTASLIGQTSGILSNCGTICMGMGNVNKPEGFNKTPEGFADTLTAFAQYVADNFRGSK